MPFEWDPTKERSNIAKHGVGFAQASAIFEGHVYTIPDERFAYGEVRYKSIGLWEGVALVVVHTERKGKERIISARKADKRERKMYWEDLTNETKD